MSTCIRKTGVFPQWPDSIGLKYWEHDGYLHSVGLAVEAITPTLTHTVIEWDDEANRGTVLYSIDLPFDDQSEMMVSTILDDRLVAVGGTNSNQILVFDPSIAGYTADSWSVLVEDMSLLIGDHVQAQGTDCAGWFIIYGGQNSSTVWKTQTFTSWTQLSNLPAELTGLCAAAVCEHDGNVLIMGGATNVAAPYSNVEMVVAPVEGYVFRHNVSGDTYDELAQDDMFRTIWCDACDDDDGNVWFCPGKNSATQLAMYDTPPAIEGNQRGLYKSANGGVAWVSQSLVDPDDESAVLEATHRCGMTNADGVAVRVAGNFQNDIWSLS